MNVKQLSEALATVASACGDNSVVGLRDTADPRTVYIIVQTLGGTKHEVPATWLDPDRKVDTAFMSKEEWNVWHDKTQVEYNAFRAAEREKAAGVTNG